MPDDITLKLNCSTTIRNILIEAIQTYTNLICPESSSPYNEKSKEELLETLDFLRHNTDKSSISISLNLYQQFCAAINFHYDRLRKELNTSVDKQNQLLLNAINGDHLSDQHLDDAIHKDNIF